MLARARVCVIGRVDVCMPIQHERSYYIFCHLWHLWLLILFRHYLINIFATCSVHLICLTQLL